MNVKWTVWLAIVVIAAVAYPCLAEEVAPPGAEVTAGVEAADPAAIRAEIHRTMAALIEARAAEEPDPEQIAELSEKLATLRTELWRAGPRAVPGEPGPGWRCPLGRDGRDWACPMWGCGRGYGFGRGRGRGPQRGYGPGTGWGYGPGPGYGPGAGAQPGFGPRW